MRDDTADSWDGCRAANLAGRCGERVGVSGFWAALREPPVPAVVLDQQYLPCIHLGEQENTSGQSLLLLLLPARHPKPRPHRAALGPEHDHAIRVHVCDALLVGERKLRCLCRRHAGGEGRSLGWVMPSLRASAASASPLPLKLLHMHNLSYTNPCRQ